MCFPLMLRTTLYFHGYIIYTVYFRKSAIFALDHLQKKYKFYVQGNTIQDNTIQDKTRQDNTIQYNTIQYKQRMMKLWFNVSHKKILGTNEKISNNLKWNKNIIIIFQNQR